MASHKTELRITVVDDFDWPALQECSILTPYSLCPRDVTVDGGELSARLTPNSLSGKFTWAESRTPTSGNTFGFPMTAVSDVFKLSPESLNPFEKHKRRLRRYTAAESALARLPIPSTLTPAQLRASAVKYAAASVATHVHDARDSLKVVCSSGRRDSTRWRAEHRLTALETLQAELKGSAAPQPGERDEARCRREANLVRFLGTRKGEALVPVFTRTHGKRPPTQGKRPHTVTGGETDQRSIRVSSPMQLHAEVMPMRETSRSEWPWETRVRSVLLNPTPKPPPPSVRPESSVALSTPTSGTFSSIDDPETPLTEFEDDEEEEEEEDNYEDYPVFRVDSARSYSPDPDRPPPRRALPPPRKPLPTPAPILAPVVSLPPITTSVTPDASYAWLADSSTWTTPSAWHGDGWEVAPTSSTASSTASPTSRSSSRASSPALAPAPPPRTPTPTRRPLPTAPTLPAPTPAPATHRFWSRERPASHRPLPPRERPVSSRPLPPLRPISEMSPAHAAVYAVRPLPSIPPPQAETQKKGFFAGLVRRRHTSELPVPPVHQQFQAEVERQAERERNKLRKRGSGRSPVSSPSSQTFSLKDRDSGLQL
ncbi:hypothetical protein K438DRAFT_1962662 [Mycena galopus ATCC 62051]|nr:hypothetical protein K438DRAFT_1962662 [Mycena galopus ATCC 62051]